MPALPEYMYSRGEQPIETFDSQERLFRRVPHDLWDDHEIELDSIVFPDMSVCRESCGKIDSARWEGTTYLDWGLIAFRVSDIPEEIRSEGAFIYHLRPCHAPNAHNWPHSEVRVFESRWETPDEEIRVTKELMLKIPREAQLRWRESIRRKSRIVLKPAQECPADDSRLYARGEPPDQRHKRR